MSNHYQVHSSVNPSKWIRWLAAFSILSNVYYVVSVALLHYFDTSVDPLIHGVSYYALGPYKHLLTAAFIFLGLGGMALTASLYLAEPAEARSWAGLSLLGLWSVTTILAGIFSLDAEGAPQTTSGVIHNLAGMNFLCIAAAAFLISRRLKADIRWQGARQTTMWLALSVIIVSLLLFVLMGVLQPLGVGGVAQRVYWLMVLVWLFFVATRLQSIAANQSPAMEAEHE